MGVRGAEEIAEEAGEWAVTEDEKDQVYWRV